MFTLFIAVTQFKSTFLITISKGLMNRSKFQAPQPTHDSFQSRFVSFKNFFAHNVTNPTQAEEIFVVPRLRMMRILKSNDFTRMYKSFLRGNVPNRGIKKMER